MGRRLVFFLSLLVASVVVFVLASVWFQDFLGSSMNNMMAEMMSGQPNNSSSGMMPSTAFFALFWLLFLGLPILIAVGAFGVAYYIAFPELPLSSTTATIASAVPPIPSALPVAPAPSPASIASGESSNEERNRVLRGTASVSWSTLMKASTAEERSVLGVLASHDGRYLQKQIVRESGLSKLKTHRIIARFAQRGIVTVRRQGNTNEIALADWLQKGNAEEQKQQRQW
jgi:hypothetical protein